MIELLKKILPAQHHPDRPLQANWNALQWAIALLPFSTLLMCVGTVLLTFKVCQQRFRQIARRPISRGLAIVGLLMVISAAFAPQPGDAFLGAANFLPFFLVFAALSELIQTPAHLRRLAWLLVAGSLPVVLIGLGQMYLGWGGHVQILWVLFNWRIDPMGTPPGRMASIFFYANVLASYLIVTFTLSLGLLIETVWNQKSGARSQESGVIPSLPPPLPPSPPSPLPHSPSLPPSHLPTPHHSHPSLHLTFLTLAVLGNAVALILTNSRNAWAIAILACLAFALYCGWRWLLAIVGVVAGSITLAAFGPSSLREWLRAIVPAFFWARLTDELYPNRPLADLRTTQWQFAWDMVQQRPFTGWGFQSFSTLYQAKMHVFLGHPHNLPLMLAAESGLPVALLLVGLVGWGVFQGVLCLIAWRSPHTSPSFAPQLPSVSTGSPTATLQDSLMLFTTLTAFLGCTLFSLLDVPLFDPRINLLGWLLFAGICGVGYDRKRGEKSDREKS